MSYMVREGVDARTRDGRRATNIYSINSRTGYVFAATIDSKLHTLTRSGEFYKGQSRPEDLVADWDAPTWDEPAPPAPIDYAAIKPGDTVVLGGEYEVNYGPSSDDSYHSLSLRLPNAAPYWIRSAFVVAHKLKPATIEESDTVIVNNNGVDLTGTASKPFRGYVMVLSGESVFCRAVEDVTLVRKAAS